MYLSHKLSPSGMVPVSQTVSIRYVPVSQTVSIRYVPVSQTVSIRYVGTCLTNLSPSGMYLSHKLSPSGMYLSHKLSPSGMYLSNKLSPSGMYLSHKLSSSGMYLSHKLSPSGIRYMYSYLSHKLSPSVYVAVSQTVSIRFVPVSQTSSVIQCTDPLGSGSVSKCYGFGTFFFNLHKKCYFCFMKSVVFFLSFMCVYFMKVHFSSVYQF
jgi:hypothetical protein